MITPEPEDDDEETFLDSPSMRGKKRGAEEDESEDDVEEYETMGKKVKPEPVEDEDEGLGGVEV